MNRDNIKIAAEMDEKIERFEDLAVKIAGILPVTSTSKITMYLSYEDGSHKQRTFDLPDFVINKMLNTACNELTHKATELKDEIERLD